ncbi:MAG: DUF1343 domain-containing protein [Halobacteriovoraceae bacterium]|jgi:uncharacterized protein YbbC (DUF1343 family)|nr:DUF1343 domain-containing protein [Halobacteriovoraceae bacterium]
MPQVATGIMRLKNEKSLQEKYTGNIGVLCHSASIDEKYNHSLEVLIEIYGQKVKKVFGPQHGFVTDVQDNMIETDHVIHPYFKLPVYSLYSETRIPTDEMLAGIDHLFIDLQDVGTRIYTYIYTLTHLLEKCADKEIEIIVLDRPNPINAVDIEGNILDTQFASFVGRHPMPVRHGLTIGEVALMHQSFWCDRKCNLSIIEMKNYSRQMNFYDTKLPYVNPSPNLPTVEGCFTFVGTVLFEGTNISEGRGTTRSLEQIGHPCFDPWELKSHFNKIYHDLNLSGFVLRPIYFHPMFQKHAGKTCGGFHIHITDYQKFKAWKVSQIFLKKFKQLFPTEFSYKTDGYEYGGNLNPIDMINGTDKLRHWYATKEINADYLDEVESFGREEFLANRSEILLYK